MTQRFPVRDLKAVNQKKPQRMFRLLSLYEGTLGKTGIHVE